MSEMAIALLRPERIMVTSYDLTQIDRFIGYDEGHRTNGRRIRSTASPDFTVTLVSEHDGDFDSVDYDAIIVASNVPADGSTAIAPGDPVAIAQVLIDDTPWYLLICKGIGMDWGPTTDLTPSEVLVLHEGEPEDLLSRPDLFEPTD